MNKMALAILRISFIAMTAQTARTARATGEAKPSRYLLYNPALEDGRDCKGKQQGLQGHAYGDCSFPSRLALQLSLLQTRRWALFQLPHRQYQSRPTLKP